MKKNLVFALLFWLMLCSGVLKAQWQPSDTFSNKRIQCVATLDSNIFAGYKGGIYLSKDNGNNWVSANNGLPVSISVSSFAVIGSNVFAASYGDGVYLSVDTGANWTEVNRGLIFTPINTLAVNGTNIFAGTNNGVYLTTDYGSNWSAVGSNFKKRVYSIVVNDTNIFAGSDLGGIYLSTNSGSSWAQVNNWLTQNRTIRAMAVSGGNILAGTNADILLSVNNGLGWMIPSNSFFGAGTFIAAGTNVFAGDSLKGIFLSPNFGMNWGAINEGFVNRHTYSLAMNKKYLFTATDSGVWRRPLAEMVGINEPADNYNFLLYPNPVNDKLYVQGDLVSGKDVIKIYDILGKEALSINPWQSSGEKVISIDISELPSGIYFLQLKTADGSFTKKFVKE